MNQPGARRPRLSLPDEPLREVELDSVDFFELEAELRTLTGIERLPISAILEYETLRDLVEGLRAKVEAAGGDPAAVTFFRE